MRKIIIINLLVIIAALLGIAVWFFRAPKSAFNSNLNKQSLDAQFHYAYFMQQDFYTGILNPDKVKPISAQVYGGIVSHHFFVERHIARLFNSWSQQKFKTVVVLGPNHFNAGKGDVIISRQGYQTPWGILESDNEIINELLKNDIGTNEEDPFVREHSMSVEVGFIKHQFPNARIVPIIIRHNASKEKMQALAENLNKILSSNALVLASADFSHHVTNKTAQAQDKQSIDFLKSFDANSIFKLPSTQLDSPTTIYALLQYLELRGAKNMLYSNTNQALVSGNLGSTDVTSYVFSSFVK